MKTTIFFTVLISVILTSSCSRMREKNANQLLEDPKMRQELFMSILNNREYASQFIDSLVKDELCQQMILENDRLAKAICMSSKVDTFINTDSLIMDHMTKSLIKKMEADSVACDRTCTQLMETKRIKNSLNEHSAKK